jgi:hypothetical protein
MFKYTAFDLYKTNELGAYQPAVVMAGQKSREVYLASDVDKILAAIPAHLIDPDDSHYCEPLAKALGSTG